jgi:hypothetical protein
MARFFNRHLAQLAGHVSDLLMWLPTISDIVEKCDTLAFVIPLTIDFSWITG